MKATTLDLLAERVAERVLERLSELLEDRPGDDQLITAAEVAHRYGVSREWAYEHADDLGAIRLGDGPKARLRFDPATVADRLAARPHPVTKPEPPKARPRKTSGAELLPIRGCQ